LSSAGRSNSCQRTVGSLSGSSTQTFAAAGLAAVAAAASPVTAASAASPRIAAAGLRTAIAITPTPARSAWSDGVCRSGTNRRHATPSDCPPAETSIHLRRPIEPAASNTKDRSVAGRKKQTCPPVLSAPGLDSFAPPYGGAATESKRGFGGGADEVPRGRQTGIPNPPAPLQKPPADSA